MPRLDASVSFEQLCHGLRLAPIVFIPGPGGSVGHSRLSPGPFAIASGPGVRPLWSVDTRGHGCGARKGRATLTVGWSFPQAYPRRVEVNSTARWPERLEQVATLLRAEGAAILAVQDDDVRSLFLYHLDDTLSWRDVLGDGVVKRALVERAGFTAAIPAERWGESVAYALLAPIANTGSDRGVLCAMRHILPFDAVELVAAEAAARLLSMAFADAQAAALGGRDGQLEPVHPVATVPAVAPAEPVPPVASGLRVAIIESQPSTRLGLEVILQHAGMTVAMSCSTVAETVSRMAGVRFDVAIVGTLTDATASDAVRRVRSRTRAEVIVVTDTPSGPDGHAALRAGASGQLARGSAPEAIVAALHSAASGLTTLDASVLDALLRVGVATDDGIDALEIVEGGSEAAPERAEGDRAPRRAADALSPRELELLRYLAEGYTNKEIARVMVLAEDTVKKGVQSLIAKLHAADRTHAVVLALRSGLIV